MKSLRTALFELTLITFVLGGCTSEEPKLLQGEALKDPESCRSCHASHVEQWSGSMHAYAGEDPIFLARSATSASSATRPSR